MGNKKYRWSSDRLTYNLHIYQIAMSSRLSFQALLWKKTNQVTPKTEKWLYGLYIFLNVT